MRRENGALRLTLLRATQSPRQIEEHGGFPRARGDHGFQAGIRLHQLSRLGGDVTLENPIATNSAQVHIPSGDQLQNRKFVERVRVRMWGQYDHLIPTANLEGGVGGRGQGTPILEFLSLPVPAHPAFCSYGNHFIADR